MATIHLPITYEITNCKKIEKDTIKEKNLRELHQKIMEKIVNPSFLVEMTTNQSKKNYFCIKEKSSDIYHYYNQNEFSEFIKKINTSITNKEIITYLNAIQKEQDDYEPEKEKEKEKEEVINEKELKEPDDIIYLIKKPEKKQKSNQNQTFKKYSPQYYQKKIHTSWKTRKNNT